MKKWLKNSKGLTLVELLAVMVILGIIAAIAVPVIRGTIENARERADVASLVLIQDAATRWAIDTDVKTTTGFKEIQDLVDAGYLQKIPQVQSDDTTDFDLFKIVVDTKGDYTANVYDTNSASPITSF